MLSIMLMLGVVLIWAGGVLFVEGLAIEGARGMLVSGVALTVAGIGAAVCILPPLYLRTRPRPARRGLPPAGAEDGA